VFPCGHAAFLHGLTSIIDNPQYSHRLQDMVSEYKTTINRLKRFEKQLAEFVAGCESGRILLRIPGIGIINASAGIEGPKRLTHQRLNGFVTRSFMAHRANGSLLLGARLTRALAPCISCLRK
jgi:hypothetical protein